jgi:hypothetical protein
MAAAAVAAIEPAMVIRGIGGMACRTVFVRRMGVVLSLRRLLRSTLCNWRVSRVPAERHGDRGQPLQGQPGKQHAHDEPANH